ncbi:hypothetical protein F4779DRAFT_39976 [Xylariaceae sp. FL0662B]|nr:hypothetical protein F4779DRAFT_39976 [Xylariaceae sp. FL0662B]
MFRTFTCIRDTGSYNITLALARLHFVNLTRQHLLALRIKYPFSTCLDDQKPTGVAIPADDEPLGISRQRSSTASDRTPAIDGPRAESARAGVDIQSQELSADLFSAFHEVFSLNQHSCLGFASIEATLDILGKRMLPINERQPQLLTKFSECHSQDSDNPPIIGYEVQWQTYTCFYLLAASVILLISSLGISLWWSIDHGDVSGGFGIGSYTVGISGLIIALASYTHRSHCRCWTHGQLLLSPDTVYLTTGSRRYFRFRSM